MMQHAGKNIVIVLALVAAGFLAAWLRFRPYLEGAGSYTDGAAIYDVGSSGDVRYAVWDPPFELPGEINTHENERDPATSPDGRFLVFVSGESDAGSDLWVSELVDGVARETRPLTELNSGRGEIGPAFSNEHLYFASNRPGGAGGFDLWRARYESGEFSEAERLGGGLNTAADEVDPAPLGEEGEVLFASNRKPKGGKQEHYDLYAASLDDADKFEIVALDTLNSPAEERDLAVSVDGSALFFASDREGSFDLYRSAHTPNSDEAKFLPPTILTALASDAIERGPAPSRDGFTLTFSSELESRDADLWRAHSRELYRKPGRPVGWMELAILAALLLLALLAKLSTKWSGLEVLYKCLLVSLLVHLLLLWWFRHVHPESEKVEFEQDGPRVRVHLLSQPSTNIAQNAERAGRVEAAREAPVEIELARLELAAVEESSEQAAALAIDAGESPEVARPGRSVQELERAESETAEVELRSAEDPRVLRDGAAPTLEHALAMDAARGRPEAAAQPQRRVDANRESTGAAPSFTRLERSAPQPGESASPIARGEVEFSREAASPEARETLRAPRAEMVSRAATAVALDVGSATEFEHGRNESGQEIQRVAPKRASTSAPIPSEFEALAAAVQPSVAKPKRESVEAPVERAERGEVELTLEQPTHSFTRETPVEAKPAEPLARASFARASTSTLAQPAPARFERRAEPPPAAPTMAKLAVAAPATPEDLPTERKRWDHTPYQSRSGSAKLRALEEHGGSPETERAVAAGLSYLANKQRSRGNWGRTNWRDDKYLETTIGKTGLSLLAFLGAGHTQNSKSEYSDVVESALGFLIESQGERTGHFGVSSSYSHAIATYALAECYALTKDARLKDPLTRATAHIKRHQMESRDPRFDGGWGYYYPDGRTFDRWPRASVTVWQVMALESARLGGLQVDDEVFARARKFLLGCWDRRREAFRYSHDPDRLSSGYPVLPGSTPASLFALSILGVDVSSNEFGPARAYVLDRKPRRYAPRSNDAFVNRAEGNLYFWYYSTLSLFRAGGAAWDDWNGAMKSTLLGSQSDDGSWAAESPYSAEYAGDTNRDRCYSTAMCVLSLEVYYRYFTPLLKVD